MKRNDEPADVKEHRQAVRRVIEAVHTAVNSTPHRHCKDFQSQLVVSLLAGAAAVQDNGAMDDSPATAKRLANAVNAVLPLFQLYIRQPALQGDDALGRFMSETTALMIRYKPQTSRRENFQQAAEHLFGITACILGEQVIRDDAERARACHDIAPKLYDYAARLMAQAASGRAETPDDLCNALRNAVDERGDVICDLEYRDTVVNSAVDMAVNLAVFGVSQDNATLRERMDRVKAKTMAAMNEALMGEAHGNAQPVRTGPGEPQPPAAAGDGQPPQPPGPVV